MATYQNGNIVETVDKGSISERAGIKPGDVILSLNRHKIHDSLDLMYYSAEPVLRFTLERKGKKLKIEFERSPEEPLGIHLKPFRIKRCKNRCIFCFVKQLPKGLRRSLYIKDEDFRMSFLYGNYITLTNLSQQEKRRIINQHLSPLYISVHSTNQEVRNKLLGNKNAPDIKKELRWLTRNRIRFHSQIVLCPGYNDDEELKNTLQDLLKFYPYLLSVAVVPVGLTRYVKTELKPVSKEDALKALEIIEEFQKRCIKKYGDPIVYGADELYLKAEKKFPALKYYGDFPQIENGVGMIKWFMTRAKRIKPPKAFSSKRFLTVTGTSFYPFLRSYLNTLKDRVSVDVLEVKNEFFGPTVTVTGLLTGRDIIRTAVDRAESYDILLLPDVVLRDGKDLLLDDVSVSDIKNILKIDVRVIESTPRGLITALEGR
ncbi:MAG: DUF512 domain-containing protein [Nitrospirae bacterium]|nr:MAG: DUF512 domain-containing protein [Nitrospirota bacterium]